MSEPGASTTPRRNASTGSSTHPVVPDSVAPGAIAAASTIRRPRPRKRIRSVSHDSAAAAPPTTSSAQPSQIGGSDALRRLRVSSSTPRAASNSLSTNIFENAGCASSGPSAPTTASA